jgi:hypothetical protein
MAYIFRVEVYAEQPIKCSLGVSEENAHSIIGVEVCTKKSASENN